MKEEKNGRREHRKDITGIKSGRKEGIRGNGERRRGMDERGKNTYEERKREWI